MARLLAAVLTLTTLVQYESRVQTQSSTPLYVAFLGDAGTGGVHQAAVRDQLMTARAAGRLDAVILLGDNVYDDGQAQGIRARYVDVYRPLLDDGVQFHAVLGNHDVQRCEAASEDPLPSDHRAYTGDRCDAEAHLSEDSRFGYQMERRYYAARIPAESPVLEILALDSNTLASRRSKVSVDDTAQLEWLDAALAGGEGAWKVVAMHHPMHSPAGGERRLGLPWPSPKRGHEPEMRLRRQLAARFERAKVDIVFQGHNHFYSRLLPQGGVRFIVSGGGGEDVYRYDPEPGYTAPVAERGRFHHFVHVRVDQRRFEFCAKDSDGATRDSGWFERGSEKDLPFEDAGCPF